MFPIFSGPDEQKIGTAVECISGKTAFGVESGSNNIHVGGSVHSTYNESMGKNLADSC
jgi:hypothetical protein